MPKTTAKQQLQINVLAVERLARRVVDTVRMNASIADVGRDANWGDVGSAAHAAEILAQLLNTVRDEDCGDDEGRRFLKEMEVRG